MTAAEQASRESKVSKRTWKRRAREVFAALNSVTALRHAMEHAGVQRERVGEALAKLDVEERRVRGNTTA